MQLTFLSIEADSLYAGLSGGAGVAQDLGEKGEVDTKNWSLHHLKFLPGTNTEAAFLPRRKKNVQNVSTIRPKSGAHLHLGTISLSHHSRSTSERLTCCQLTDVTSCPTCASPYAFTHWRTQMRVTMVTSIICKSHQKRISPTLFFSTTTITITTVQIKPNYTLLLFLSDNKGGRWGWGRFNAIIEILSFFAWRGEGETRCDGRLLVKMPIDDEARKPNLQS